MGLAAYYNSVFYHSPSMEENPSFLLPLSLSPAPPRRVKRRFGGERRRGGGCSCCWCSGFQLWTVGPSKLEDELWESRSQPKWLKGRPVRYMPAYEDCFNCFEEADLDVVDNRAETNPRAHEIDLLAIARPSRRHRENASFLSSIEV